MILAQNIPPESDATRHGRALGFLRALPLGEIDTVLDAGAGWGLQAQWFQSHGKSVVCADLRKPRAPGLVGYICNLAALPFQAGQFDAVWCNHALEHVENPTKALREFRRVLRDKGWMLLTVPTLGSNVSSGHINGFSHALVVYLLAMSGFTCRGGHFMWKGSSLRAAVRPAGEPFVTGTSLRILNENGLLPASAEEAVRKTGRLSEEDLDVCWFENV